MKAAPEGSANPPRVDFPNSPQAVLHDLLGEFQQGRLSPEDFLQALQRVDSVLEQWAAATTAVSLPQENPEAERLVEATIASLQLVADACNALREYLTTGDEQLAHEGLTLAGQGQDLLTSLLAVTSDALEQIEA